MQNDLRRWMTAAQQMVLCEGTEANLIFRFVDERAAISYVRANAMIARHRHFLPKQLSGEFHSKFKKGLSFSYTASKWGHPGTPICFVVDRARLDVPAADINGQAVFVLSQTMALVKAGHGNVVSREQYQDELRMAINDSRTDPDEVFVMGDIRDLGSKLTEIIINPRGDELSAKGVALLRAYCARYDIPFQVA